VELIVILKLVDEHRERLIRRSYEFANDCGCIAGFAVQPCGSSLGASGE